MNIEELRTLFKLLSLTGTLDILFDLYERGKARYTEFGVKVNTYSKTTRLHELCVAKLIEHHLEKDKKRKEWYELTEKGRRLVEQIRKMEIE